MEIKEILKREFGENLKYHESMKKHTYIGIGGPAEYFFTAYELDKLVQSIKIAQKMKIPYLVIGSGSNIIVSDNGFEGIIIKNESSKLISENNSAFVETGITLFRLIRKLAELNLGGLEFLSGIPGTLGGAIYGNAGAYGKNMSDLVENISVLDSDGEIKQFKNKDFGFRYRESILKARAKISTSYNNRPVILSTRLKINPKEKESVLRVVQNYVKIRGKKNPVGLSAGSTFKNVEINNEKMINPQLKVFANDNIIPTGLLIDRSGLKGLRVGKIQISNKHGNILVNLGNGKAIDYYNLTQIIKEKVKEKYDIKLEEEVEYIGDLHAHKKGIFERVFKK
jgi:UDP-N-acetylmuramate dehydrogenase